MRRAVSGMLVLLCSSVAAPVLAQSDGSLGFLPDGAYGVNGQAMSVQRESLGQTVIKFDKASFVIDSDGGVSVAGKQAFGNMLGGGMMPSFTGQGRAGPRGMLINGSNLAMLVSRKMMYVGSEITRMARSSVFIGRGVDGANYAVWFSLANGQKYIFKFGKIAESKQSAVDIQASAAEVEAAIGCPLEAMQPCLGNRSAPPPPVTVAEVRPQGGTVAPAAIAIPSGPRLALILANARYSGGLSPLANPVNDARLVQASLQAAGFVTIMVADSDQRAMKRAIVDFGAKLAAAGRGATGLFYYAGHGVQSRGANYLVPVGANIASEADIDIEAVAADNVIRQMEQAGATTNIVILDACRNLPVQRSARDGSRGLARMDAPGGSFIAYSTAPGAVAQDGGGANSPFASALAQELRKPDQTIEEVFRNVRKSVIARTAGQQTPWDSSSLTETFRFLPLKR